jgi:hypothetical protein
MLSSVQFLLIYTKLIYQLVSSFRVSLLGAVVKLNNERTFLSVFSEKTKNLVIFKIGKIEKETKSPFSNFTPLSMFECIIKEENIDSFEFFDDSKMSFVKEGGLNIINIKNSAVISKISTVKLKNNIHIIMPFTQVLVYDPQLPSDNIMIDVNNSDPEHSLGEKIPMSLTLNTFLRVYVSQSNNVKIMVYTNKFVVLKKSAHMEYIEYQYENEIINFGYFWSDIFIFCNEKSLNMIVPYFYENSAPRIFQFFSRDFNENEKLFPLQKILFVRIIDNKILIFNDLFEFAFLPITNKLVLSAFQIELLDLKTAFEHVKDSGIEDQLTFSKGIYVI